MPRSFSTFLGLCFDLDQGTLEFVSGFVVLRRTRQELRDTGLLRVRPDLETRMLFNHLIDGEWITDGAGSLNVNPSNTNDVIGESVRGTRAHADAAVTAAKAAFPAWSRFTPQARYEILKKASDEILARKDELGRLLSREEGKTLPEGVGEAARAGQIFTFFAGECLRMAARSCRRFAPASRSRSPASRSASSASSRPGISPSRSPPGRSRRRWPTATAWCSSRRIWCRAAPGR